MEHRWRQGAEVELMDRYHLVDGEGKPVSAVTDAEVAFEGGFAHIKVPGHPGVQVVSAPAVLKITYPEDSCSV